MTKFISLRNDFATQNLIVIGDVFLDEYLSGRAERLSREAPIPVLAFRSRRQLPGGGANPAVNAAALGATVSQVGVVGDDAEATVLRGLLTQAGVDASGLIVDPARPTITKTRIVAEGELRFPQQVARIDKGSYAPLEPALEAKVLAVVRRLAAQSPVSAILVSDYRSGLLSPGLVDALRGLAREGSLRLTADTQGELDKYHGFALVKCNRAELEVFLSRSLATDAEMGAAVAEVQERLRLGVFLVTRGAQGVTVKEQGEAPIHLPAANVTEVYDVTGAGDTVIAVATLALGAGADAVTAAQLANAAAGLVVRKWGNATVTVEELNSALAF